LAKQASQKNTYAVKSQLEASLKSTEEIGMARTSIIGQIFKEMRSISNRLDNIENGFMQRKAQPLQLENSELFELPDHLRSTYLTVASKGESCAVLVSNETGRTRAIESTYLNKLTRMGWLSKRRDSKTIYFSAI
jgi:hypothetical protein